MGIPISIVSAILVIDGVQSINVLKTFENVRPFESVQNNSKLSCVYLVGSNTTLKLVPLRLELRTNGDVDPYFKI